jgi:hypothetical protein
MLRVSLPLFVSFMLATAELRITEARRFKAAKHEGPIGDFYAPLRADLIAHAQGKSDDQVLVDAAAKQSDARKRAIFPPLVSGYLAFCRESGASCVDYAPPSGVLLADCGRAEIVVAPELVFDIDGRPTALQLWYQGEPCTDRRARLTCGLMAAALGSQHPNLAFAVLDLPRGRLLRAGKPIPNLQALTDADAGAFTALVAAL